VPNTKSPPKQSPQHLKATVGVSHIDVSDRTNDDTILQRLNSGGKCHDWAATAIYYLSADKFMSHSLVMCFRWTTWVTLLFAFFLSAIIKGTGVQVGMFCELSLIFVNLMDAANIRMEQLSLSSTEMKKVATHRKYLDILKFVGVVSLLFLFDTYTYLGGSMRCWQYVIYLAVTFLIALAVHFILEEYNEPSNEDTIKQSKTN
jgi:hypothetical protein